MNGKINIMKNKPDLKIIDESFTYNNGKLFWKIRPVSHFNSISGCNIFNSNFSSKEAGYIRICKNAKRQLTVISIKKKIYRMYRYQIIWALFNREWVNLLDHINNNSLDDRIENLRIATCRENIANSKIKKNNSSGYKGVYWRSDRKKWCAQARLVGKPRHLGFFDNAFDAHLAYKNATEKEYGEFVNFN